MLGLRIRAGVCIEVTLKFGLGEAASWRETFRKSLTRWEQPSVSFINDTFRFVTFLTCDGHFLWNKDAPSQKGNRNTQCVQTDSFLIWPVVVGGDLIAVKELCFTRPLCHNPHLRIQVGLWSRGLSHTERKIYQSLGVELGVELGVTQSWRPPPPECGGHALCWVRDVIHMTFVVCLLFPTSNRPMSRFYKSWNTRSCSEHVECTAIVPLNGWCN